MGLEFMPYSGVPDLAAGWSVVRDAGEPNGALVVDAWHWARSGTTNEDLEPVPPDTVVAVQLCDVLAEPMTVLREESLHHRLPPGDGYGDVRCNNTYRPCTPPQDWTRVGDEGTGSGGRQRLTALR